MSSRITDTKCREEILQVFCAYNYNPMGDCVPPFLLKKVCHTFFYKYTSIG